MKPSERDNLLSAIAERTANIYHLTEKQEVHLSKLNENIIKHAQRLAVVETKVDERTVSRISKRALTGYSGVIIVIATLIFYLGQARGWW